ncbi:hypothetical protein [Burkholderia sp. JKS000303]|uniref:hypothetical protein n=1 Tax=Burkholderia sp. JKS000303 TaxID=1938747 RepID=UPI001C54E075|nr:hypothetical protein [Burkholderia sp. JKS000303]
MSFSGECRFAWIRPLEPEHGETIGSVSARCGAERVSASAAHARVPTQNGRANSGSRYDAVQWRLASLRTGTPMICADVRDNPHASGTLPDRLHACVRLH